MLAENPGRRYSSLADNSLLRNAFKARLNGIQNRDELWRVLITITARKANALQQTQKADKRGNGAVRGDSVFGHPETPHQPGFQSLEDSGDPNRFVDKLVGECRERIESLPDKTLQEIALKRMEGYEVAEIALQLGVSKATINRRLARIRGLWSET